MKKEIISAIAVLSLIGLSVAGCDYCYRAVKKRDYDLAIKECTEQVNTPHISDSTLARSYVNRGVAYSGKGLSDQAIADFSKAIETDPKLYIAYNNRGTTYLQRDLTGQAIADFTKTLSLKSDFTFARYNRAIAYKKEKRFSDAMKDMDDLIQENKKDDIAYSIRASVYSENGEFDRALIDHDKAIALNPKAAANYDLRGSTYMRHGQYRQAENDFHKAIELAPKYSSPYYNMACLFSLENDVDKACTWLSKSVDAGFSNWTLIRNDDDLNNIREAPCYQKILAEHPDNPKSSPASEIEVAPAPGKRLFSKGLTGITFLFGRGKAFHNTYRIYGLRVGHYVANGLEAGLSLVDWTGPSPGIVQAEPDVRYVFYEVPYVKPYAGLFYRHSFVQGYENGVDEIGGRAGVNFLLSRRSYLGAGIVYRSTFHCNVNCTSVDPEIMAAILF